MRIGEDVDVDEAQAVTDGLERSADQIELLPELVAHLQKNRSDLGRSSLESGGSLLDIMSVHHSVLIDALAGIEGPEELADAAATFLVEVLASFDMTHRAFLEQRDPS